jgi:hypothetical protein
VTTSQRMKRLVSSLYCSYLLIAAILVFEILFPKPLVAVAVAVAKSVAK